MKGGQVGSVEEGQRAVSLQWNDGDLVVMEHVCMLMRVRMLWSALSKRSCQTIRRVSVGRKCENDIQSQMLSAFVCVALYGQRSIVMRSYSEYL